MAFATPGTQVVTRLVGGRQLAGLALLFGGLAPLTASAQCISVLLVVRHDDDVWLEVDEVEHLLASDASHPAPQHVALVPRQLLDVVGAAADAMPLRDG